MVIFVEGQEKGGLLSKQLTYEVDAIKGTVNCLAVGNKLKLCGEELKKEMEKLQK